MQLIEFNDLEDFIRRQNNFYIYFLDDCSEGERFRNRQAFKRFQRNFPLMVSSITRATLNAFRAQPKKYLPYEQLWVAYKIMSKYVHPDDDSVMRDCQLDARFLVR